MNTLEKYLINTNQSNRNTGAIAYLAALDHLSKDHPEIASAIKKELESQRSHLKLIASENYSSLATQLAMGNLLTDKYAEGFVQHRFYAGCENVDTVEARAEALLKELFQAETAYAQPHSGSDANQVALWSIIVQKVQTREVERLGKKSLDELDPAEYEKLRQILVNQRLLGMSLNAGGHLSHGYRHNISSKMMQAFHYDVDPKTELVDYGNIANLAKEIKPLILLAGYSAYPRRLNFAKLKEIADSVEAVLMVDMAHFSGLVAGGVFTGDENPVPFADIVTSTTHKTLRGPRGGIVLAKQEYADIIHKGCPLVMGGPLPHVMAAKAVAFKEALSPNFKNYANQIVKNAKALANTLMEKGIRLTTGGTDNHLVIADVSSFNLTGRHAELALGEAGFTINRNAIPFDKNGAWYTSGIRIGTPAITTLGMGEKEMEKIGTLIFDILSNTQAATNEKTGQKSKAHSVTNPEILSGAKREVEQLLGQFPLYPEISS